MANSSFQKSSIATPVSVANGGTGVTAAGTSGNVLTSNGTDWASTAPAAGGGTATYACGQTTRTSASGTGTQDIAHGLGVTPDLIKINATAVQGGVRAAFSCGSATGTSDETCTYWGTRSGSTAEASGGQNSGAIVYIPLASDGSSKGHATLSSLDATNITLTWVVAVDAAFTPAYIQWEAWAFN